MAESPHRLFVAVPVPAVAIEACRTLLDAVRSGPADRGARWVRTENLHLTLRFLGEVEPERTPDIAAALVAGVTGCRAFEIALAGAGAFPTESRPRALWLGIAEGADELGALARTLTDPLAALGWPADSRPFRPHLTVGRTDAVPAVVGAATAATLIEAARDWRISFRAERVVLYRSHLGGGPPRYAEVAEVALAG